MLRRALAKIQRAADLLDRSPFVMAQREGGTLDCRQIVERAVDHLPHFCTGGQALWPGMPGGERRRGFVDRPADFLHPLLTRAHRVDGAVRGDAIQPRPEIGFRLKVTELTEGAKEAFLDDVFGVLLVAGHAERELEDPVAVLLHQRGEGVFVALSGFHQHGHRAADVHSRKLDGGHPRMVSRPMGFLIAYGPMKRAIFGVSLTILVLTTGAAAQGGRKDGHWVGTWATAVAWRPAAVTVPATAPPVVPALPTTVSPSAAGTSPAATPAIANQTIRQFVHVSIGGSRIRVQLSNAFGTAPIEIGAANVAVRAGDGPAIVPSSSRALRFSGQPSVIIPAGAVMTSDPADVIVAPLSDLAIDLFLPGDTGAWPSPLTTHGTALMNTFTSETGNHAGAVSFDANAPTRLSWFLLSRVEVIAAKEAAAIVTVGDSITDGTRSTPNTNHRWPDELARRLAGDRTTRNLGVLNAGISGNRLLSEQNAAMGINLLARFDRDVLAQPGVKYVVVLEGINDIGMRGPGPSPSAAQLIAAHQQIIERAHAQGLKIYGATLTPFEGAAYFTSEGETKRQAVNEWIRSSKWYDAVIDFDKVIRDPANPTKFLPAYNSGDNLHPNDAGYRAMGQAVDLDLFK